MVLLQPPDVRDFDVFTSMPAEFRRTGVRSHWADVNQGGRLADSFLEGPVVDADGNLYVTDIPFGRVFRIDTAGTWSLVGEWDGEPNGMKFLSPGELLITDYRNGLVVLDLRSGQVKPFLERRNSERFKGVNDLVFDSRGNLFFTDQGQTGLHDPTGRVYRLAPDGRLDMLLSNVPSPNGIVLSPDERFLFVAATRAATACGACRCWPTAACPRPGSSSARTGRADPTAWRWTRTGGCWSRTRAWATCGC